MVMYNYTRCQARKILAAAVRVCSSDFSRDQEFNSMQYSLVLDLPTYRSSIPNRGIVESPVVTTNRLQPMREGQAAVRNQSDSLGTLLSSTLRRQSRRPSRSNRRFSPGRSDSATAVRSEERRVGKE